MNAYTYFSGISMSSLHMTCHVFVLPFIKGEEELLSPPQDTSTGLEEVMEQLNNSFPSSRGEFKVGHSFTCLTSLCILHVANTFDKMPLWNHPEKN